MSQTYFKFCSYLVVDCHSYGIVYNLGKPKLSEMQFYAMSVHIHKILSLQYILWDICRKGYK